jgi:short chain dehydrogenase
MRYKTTSHEHLLLHLSQLGDTSIKRLYNLNPLSNTAATTGGSSWTHSGKTYGEEVTDDFKGQIRGKVLLTTSVSPSGLGATLVETLAKFESKLLILAGRDTFKANATVEVVKKISSARLQARALELDLGSREQIRKAAAEVNDYGEAMDVLINNAGLMATPYGVTKDGIESQFGVNHIGHFLSPTSS